MISIKVIDELKELEEYISVYKEDNENTVISPGYESILKVLTDNDRKRWFVVKYCGRAADIQKEMSILNLGNFRSFFLDVSMLNPSASAATEIVLEFYELCDCEDGDTEYGITTDESLDDGEVGLLFIIPEYELGWQMHRLLDKQNQKEN